MKITLTNVRLAFPYLFTAKDFEGDGNFKFSATFLMPPTHPACAELRAAFDKLGQEKWGAKWPTVKKGIESKDCFALHDGDTREYDGFAGNMFVRASNAARPLVLDRDKTPLTEADGRPYGGCQVSASIELWCQDNGGGKRINASLRGVQFLKDGDRFGGGGVASADEFSTVEDAEEDIA